VQIAAFQQIAFEATAQHFAAHRKMQEAYALLQMIRTQHPDAAITLAAAPSKVPAFTITTYVDYPPNPPGQYVFVPSDFEILEAEGRAVKRIDAIIAAFQEGFAALPCPPGSKQDPPVVH
jgi:hypothetical protein